MPTPPLYLNLFLVSGGEPVVYEFDPTNPAVLHTLCQDIRDSWESGAGLAIQNPAGSEYVNSLHVARFTVT